MKAYTLRISVLENCQLRCGYCLPDSQQKFLSKKHWLSALDYQKIAKVLTRLPLAKIRFTGGEPLLRPGLPQIVGHFAQALPEVPLALTTNGLCFSASLAQSLKKAGLGSITFHLDTLKASRYEKIMGRGELGQVLDAIKRAQDLGLGTKINTVVQKNCNHDELVDFLALSKKIGVEVRFIEMMNTGSAQRFVADKFISGQEILALLGQKFSIQGRPRLHPSEPAEAFWAEELELRFGLIASDTRPFCQNCNRLRLSADGRLHTCLYDDQGADLAIAESEDVIWARLQAKIAQKTSMHPMLNARRRIFSMSQIGG